jgi:N-acyl-D-amino-acid deacylase
VGDLLKRWDLPGAALAVAREGRLVLARGYGLADTEQKLPVRPDALFRIASVSKPPAHAPLAWGVGFSILSMHQKAY